jgi:catechol 2,3-dioxygenase-like lactoylglutathione lyase family enzyme
MTVIGIDTVAIVVSDRTKAIRWYRDVLGLRVAYVGPSGGDSAANEGTPDNAGHWIEMGPGRPRTRIHLCEMGGATEPGPTGITFLSDDIRAEYERMRSKGVRFLSPPTKMEWGEWLCQFVDPDGNGFDLKQAMAPTEWRP